MKPRAIVAGSVESKVLASQMRLPGQGPPSGRTKRSQQHKIGDRGEARARAIHKPCELAGICSGLRHGDSGLRPVGSMRPDGTIPSRPKEKGDVDFHATLRGGRALWMEVKHIGDDPPRFDLDQLKEHQAGILASEHAMGALSLVLVVSDRRSWALPWPVVAAAREVHAKGGRASIGADALEPWLLDERTPWLRRWMP